MTRTSRILAVATIGILAGLGSIFLAVIFFRVCYCLVFGIEECRADDTVATNYLSNIQPIVRHQWQMVTYGDDGTFSDPSGLLVSAARTAANEQRADRAILVTAGAASGLTNALERLIAVTNKLPERSISIALHLPPGVDRQNLYLYAPKIETDGTNDTFYVAMNYSLGTVPKVASRYQSPAGDLEWVDGTWTRFFADSYTVQEGGKRVGNVYSGGCTYYGCKRLVFKRPAFAIGLPVRFNKHLRIGHPEDGFSATGCMITVDGYETFTGVFTNRTKTVVKTFQSGILTDVKDISSEGSSADSADPDNIQ